MFRYRPLEQNKHLFLVRGGPGPWGRQGGSLHLGARGVEGVERVGGGGGWVQRERAHIAGEGPAR